MARHTLILVISEQILCSRALARPNCKAAFPHQQVTPRGSCWGTLHLFTPFLRLPETRHGLDSTPLAGPSPPPRDTKTVQAHSAWAKQIHSPIRSVKFYAISLIAMITLMQSPHEQQIILGRDLCSLAFWQRVQLSKGNTKCTYFWVKSMLFPD